MTSAPTVSVLTAAYEFRSEHLLDAYRSLLTQRTDWEWVLQLDGDAGADAVPEEIRDDPRVLVEPNGQHLGVETTRNLGLTRARGRFVQNLDHDDHLLEAGFDVTSEALAGADGDVAFCFGDAVDLHDDGRTEPNGDNRALEPGFIEPGTLFDLWEAHGFVPLHNAGVLWRADILRVYGGWAAVPNAGDTATIMAVAERHRALYIGVPTIVYRRHEAQTVQTDEYLRRRERNWECAKVRVRAIRELEAVRSRESRVAGPDAAY